MGTLHLTFGVLSLETEERKRTACDLLRSPGVLNVAYEKIDYVPSSDNRPSDPTRAKSSGESTIDPQTIDKEPELLPFSVTLSGLHSMGSPSATTVLYARPEDPASRLHNLCTAIREIFKSADLLVHEDRPLLLHATIINTTYNRPPGHGSRRKSNRRIDATELIEKYAKFELAKNFRVEKVSICKMGAQNVVEDGVVVDSEYLELCHVDLP